MANQTWQIQCLSRAISPLTHMARTEGNEAILMREPVVTPTGVRWIPLLSGNALRHRLVREPGARFLVERWGLAGKLTLRQLNFLFHGGTLTGTTARNDPAGIAAFHRLFPLLRLLGGSLATAILPGSLIADRGILICRENASRVAAMSGRDVPANLRSAEAFIGGYQYTRGDAANTATDLLPAEIVPDASLMIFAGQAVIAGACFLHGFVARNAGPLEIGALLLSLSLWQQAGGTIGGQGARGHGRLDMRVSIPGLDAAAAAAAVRAYAAHVDAAREEGTAWLEAAFAPAAAEDRAGAAGAAAKDGKKSGARKGKVRAGA